MVENFDIYASELFARDSFFRVVRVGLDSPRLLLLELLLVPRADSGGRQRVGHLADELGHRDLLPAVLAVAAVDALERGLRVLAHDDLLALEAGDLLEGLLEPHGHVHDLDVEGRILLEVLA